MLSLSADPDGDPLVAPCSDGGLAPENALKRRTMGSLHACTIIARNYLPYARAFTQSFLTHHDDGHVTVLVIDKGDHEADEPFDVVGLYDIGLDPHEARYMATIYDLKELATAVKPSLLKYLLARGATEVAYFDPDIQVFSSLHDLYELASEHSILLTPHMTAPFPQDGRLPDHTMILQAGIYNLGFIAVSSRAAPFLDWWQERLARDCVIDVDRALFVDQRWVDLVPALFEHHVLRDPTCNAAYWNLHERDVQGKDGRYEVDGCPLRFFHFSGYNPSAPQRLTSHTGGLPRILLSERPGVAELCRQYSELVVENGYDEASRPPYGWDSLAGGFQLTASMRRLFREALREAERDGSVEPPDPFDAPEAFLAWLKTPRDETHTRHHISRYLESIRTARRDLKAAFPDVPGPDSRRFLEWAITFGVREERIPKELLPDVDELEEDTPPQPHTEDRTAIPLLRLSGAHPVLRRIKPILRALEGKATSAYSRVTAPESVPSRTNGHRPQGDLEPDNAAKPRPGVNVVGYFRAELGIAEVARKLVTAVERSGIPYRTLTYERTLSRQQHPFPEDAPNAVPYDTNIICVNADQLPYFQADADKDFFAERYSIGVWFWEISHFPSTFHGSFDLVDEIWVASEFVRQAISAHTSKPVRVLPLPLEAPAVPVRSRADLGLPAGFLFFFSFDFLSVFERKNPIALVKAFTQTFARGEGPVLVIKTINGERDIDSLERLRLEAVDRPDVQIIDGYVDAEDHNAMMAACDCYVSLHRSEGFGLTMAEAVAHGKPVIATGYSGNLDFLHEENSYLVPYTLVAIPEGLVYPAGIEWAEPDIGEAARLMRKVYEQPDEALALGQRAREDLLKTNSLTRTADFVAQRVDEVRGSLDAAAPPAPPRAEPLAAPLAKLVGLARDVNPLRERTASTTSPYGPTPGEELIWRVTGQRDVQGFNDSGPRSVQDIERALAVVGTTLQEHKRVLDFGCGCGRTLRWLNNLGSATKLYGIDIDHDAIDWVRTHVPYVDARVNQGLPPTDFPDGFFDLVFNHSVFTHLDEQYQDAWLSELRRITKPAGTVLLTISGERPFEGLAEVQAAAGNSTEGLRQVLRDKGILFVEDDGWTGGPFPDFYHSTFHAPWYIFEHWGQFFEIKAYIVGGALGFLDMVVLEARTREA